MSALRAAGVVIWNWGAPGAPQAPHSAEAPRSAEAPPSAEPPPSAEASPSAEAPRSVGYSASHTWSSCWFRKWLGVIVQPRSFALCGTTRYHVSP